MNFTPTTNQTTIRFTDISTVTTQFDFVVTNISVPGACDLDGDGIINSLDLDSDGDGCSDALEGGAAFTTSNLVSSTLAGGNSGPSYTGTSTTPVTQNLGNTVGNTATTLGVPTLANTGQSVGTSQNATTQDIFCNLQPPFSCTTGTAYLFQQSPTNAYTVNLVTGATTLVASGIVSGTTNRELNAVGYNVTDNYIWGYRQNTNQVVRIGSDFSTQGVSIPGLPTGLGF